MDGLMSVEILDIIVIGKNTILTPDNARDKITLRIIVSYSLLVYDSLSRGREVAPYGIQAILYLGYLVESYGCSCISLNTTLSLTSIEITTELLRQNL